VAAHLRFLDTWLKGGLWHVTRPDRFASIMATGALVAEPDLPDAERWKTSQGPDYYPFVRKIGGVSLFDFRNFDADAYDEAYCMSSWRTFVPCPARWDSAVWLRVDVAAIEDRFISADEVVHRWDEGGHHRHTIMPRIEAACIGELPVTALSQALVTVARGFETREIDVPGLCRDIAAGSCPSSRSAKPGAHDVFEDRFLPIGMQSPDLQLAR
jgi:hypothetical protein